MNTQYIVSDKSADNCSPEMEVNDNFPQLPHATSYEKLLKALKRNEAHVSRVRLKRFLLICNAFSFTDNSVI